MVRRYAGTAAVTASSPAPELASIAAP
jgi:hypothetical protein